MKKSNKINEAVQNLEESLKQRKDPKEVSGFLNDYLDSSEEKTILFPLLDQLGVSFEAGKSGKSMVNLFRCLSADEAILMQKDKR